MTDITELAQSLKAAAEKATQGNWRAFQYHDGRCGIGGGHHDEIMVCEHISKERPHDAMFIALANPANVLALVEALEKARQRITQMESRTVTDWIEHDGKWRPESLGLDELVYLKTRKQELKIPYPAGKVKGWMNTGGDMDVMAYKLASPQASTVTVKLPLPRRKTADDYVDDTFEPCDLAAVYNACRLECEVKFKNALTAAGIKVEAE
ncbi:ead/Ea22-like family protein [Klebsiella pneumoniae]|uniref:ead/Ea22-like family protein n=1 Tax=Klebsiella pneumoniae TaxID=573 RepID=UPI0010B06AD7|nr:ead/Ea22-like family protein [Klebsiella pneumoniae]VGF99816.1 Ead domain protein [Klebsiella pneumoniae]